MSTWFDACFKSPPKKKHVFVDVVQALKDEAWMKYMMKYGAVRRIFIRRSHYEIDVPYSNFAFTSTIPENEQEYFDTTPVKSYKDFVVFNLTGEKQTTHIRFSKIRSSTVNVTYQTGISFGTKTDIKIGLPKSIGQLAFCNETKLEINESNSVSSSESETTEVTSDIVVLPMKKYVAGIQVEERVINTKFQDRIRMSMPKGKARIYIRRKSDNVVVHVIKLLTLRQVFFRNEETISRFPGVKNVVDDNKVVDIVVKGFIKGKVVCDHIINLTSDETAIRPGGAVASIEM